VPEPLFRLYLAVSLDGYIARRDGSYDWLLPYEPERYGYAEFLASVGTIVMGRASYDQVRDHWSYQGKRTVVLTSRPLDASPPPDVEPWSGDVGPRAEELRKSGAGDVWLFGGAAAVRPFLAAGLVDRVELGVVPLLLGDGIRLFDGPTPPIGLRLESAVPYPDGLVLLAYARGEGTGAAPAPAV
jgi:dihydrofolate reductase